jgi:endonuclease III
MIHILTNFLLSSHPDSAILIVTGMAAGRETPDELANATALDLMNYFKDDPSLGDEQANAIINICKNIVNNHGGTVPQDRATLKSYGVDDVTASLLLTQVFGATELIVGLHARKILIALDMVDWEFTGEEKTKLKLSKLPAEKVKRSLFTWLPKGEASTFHDTMNSIGNLLCARTQGDWGRITKAINSHFSPKEKDVLMNMAETICQFYKATRNGGKVLVRPNAHSSGGPKDVRSSDDDESSEDDENSDQPPDDEDD